MSECKDYKLETLRAILPDFDDKNISIADAWTIFQKGKEEGMEIVLSDLKEFIKAQEEYDEYNERRNK